MDELIVMDTQAIRAQSQESRLAGVVRSRECGTQTEGSQGVPQERGQKRNIIEVDSDSSSDESDSEESESGDSGHSDGHSDNHSGDDSDDDDCVVIAVTYNGPVYHSLFV